MASRAEREVQRMMTHQQLLILHRHQKAGQVVHSITAARSDSIYLAPVGYQ